MNELLCEKKNLGLTLMAYEPDFGYDKRFSVHGTGLAKIATCELV